MNDVTNDVPIEQLYCTHCTYGTSALYRAEDARKEQVFEYSTRSASISQLRTHQLFQLVEQYVKFQLPGDTGAADLVRYDAHSCPWQRLAYFPSISNYRVLTRSCYRQTDTRNRPGSYFAHVLLSESSRAQPGWTAIDALQLWGSSAWVSEDAPDLPFDLPQSRPFSEWPGSGTLVNDRVLLAFLNTAPGGRFPRAVTDDADSVIPERWRTKPVTDRRKLLVDVLGTVTQLNLDRHEKLVIAVEPGLAALLFYGVFRLLPQRGIVEKISFSTYQSHLDNPTTTLSACSFSKPATDLLPDAYRSGAINTFNDKRGVARSTQHSTAAYLVETWSSDDTGRATVDALLAAAGRVGVTQIKELEELIAADQMMGRLVAPDPNSPPQERELPRSKTSRLYIQEGLIGQLAGLSADSALQRLTSVPGHALLLLGLLGTADAPADAQAIADKLCRRLLPEEQVRLLTSPVIAERFKATALGEYFEKNGKLPPDCDAIWDSRPAPGIPSSLALTLLKQFDAKGRRNSVLAALAKTFNRDNPTEPDIDRYKTAIRMLLGNFPENEAVIGSVLNELWPPNCHEGLVLALVQDHTLRDPVLRLCEVEDPVLCKLVDGLLVELPLCRGQFRKQLADLKASAKFLEPERKRILASWNKLTELFTDLGKELQSSGGWRNFGSKNSKPRILTDERDEFLRHIETILPASKYEDDYFGTRRAGVVAEVARAWLAPAELPADFSQTLAGIICPPAPAPFTLPSSPPRHKSQPLWKSWRLPVSIALTIAIIGGGAAAVKQIFRPATDRSQASTAGDKRHRDAKRPETPDLPKAPSPQKKKIKKREQPTIDEETADAGADGPTETGGSAVKQTPNPVVPEPPVPEPSVASPAHPAEENPTPKKTSDAEMLAVSPKWLPIRNGKRGVVIATRFALAGKARNPQLLLRDAPKFPIRLGLLGPLVEPTERYDNGDNFVELRAEKSDVSELTIVSLGKNSNRQTEIARIKAPENEKPTLDLLTEDETLLFSLRTCVLQITDGEQLACYLSFSAHPQRFSEPFDEKLTLTLPPSSRAFNSMNHFVVADEVSFVPATRDVREVILSEKTAYRKSFPFLEKDARRFGFAGVNIEILNGHAQIKTTALEQQDDPAPDLAAKIQAKQDDFDNALWELWSAWVDKRRTDRQKGPYVISRLKFLSESQPSETHNRGKLQRALNDATEKAHALAGAIGEEPFRRIPPLPSLNATPGQLESFGMEFQDWTIGWREYLTRLLQKVRTKINKLNQSPAPNGQQSSSAIRKQSDESQDGGGSARSLAGGAFSGNIYLVVAGETDGVGVLTEGIIIQLTERTRSAAKSGPDN